MTGRDGQGVGDAMAPDTARIVVGPDRRVCDANDAAAALLGRPMDALCGLPDSELEPRDARLLSDGLAIVAARRVPMPIVGDATIRGAEGCLIPVRFEFELREDGGYAVTMAPRGAPIRTGSQAHASQTLAAWRDAERRHAAAAHNSAARWLAAADVRVYRQAFHDAVDTAMADKENGAAD